MTDPARVPEEPDTAQPAPTTTDVGVPVDEHDDTLPDTAHVPVPAGGVRGVDQVQDMDSEPGEGTTRGADGDTAAREALREDLGERAMGAGNEDGDDLEQAAALGETDDPQGGSLQGG